MMRQDTGVQDILESHAFRAHWRKGMHGTVRKDMQDMPENMT
jgi:hypothetical protein